MTIDRLLRLLITTVVCLFVASIGTHGLVASQRTALAVRWRIAADSSRPHWRNMPMPNHHRRPPPHEESRIQPSRFKTLRHYPALVQMESVLRQINKWQDPAVQQQIRLARVGTEAGRARALANLAAIIEEYKAEVVSCQDPYMPYANTEQISNGDHGIHILDQVHNEAQLRIDEENFLLNGVCANATGDKLSILAVFADIFSKQDSFGRIWLWMVPDIMNLTAPKG